MVWLWIILAAYGVMSIWSIIDAIQQKHRFFNANRLKYYFFFYLANSVLVLLLFRNEISKLLLWLCVIYISILFGNAVYYTRVERIKNIHQHSFRQAKYLFVFVVILAVAAILTTNI